MSSSRTVPLTALVFLYMPADTEDVDPELTAADLIIPGHLSSEAGGSR